MQAVSALLFAAFLAQGVWVRLARAPGVRRRRIVRLVAYVVVASLAVGVAQRDAWPITSHTIAVGRAHPDARVCLTEFAGVGASGREQALDPYSWSPVFASVLQYWWDRTSPRLGPAQRDEVLAFLLRTAEARRARLAAGEPIGPQRWLGPFGAPYWLLLPRPPAASEPLAGLRVYRSCWMPRDPAAVTRTLVAERP